MCGAQDIALVCDEVWHYDDVGHVATLARLRIICRMCSFVKHIGHAGILAREGKLKFEELVAHFCRVNTCDEDAFERHRTAAFAQWEERSRHEWRIEFGEFAAYLSPTPDASLVKRWAPADG